MGEELVITSGPGGRILTNANVWSPDGEWIVYDTRSDPAGERFDGTRIQIVNVKSREVRTVYESRNGACCGAASWHPKLMRVAFILGPEHPTPEWGYGASRRRGVMVDVDRPGVALPIDARDLVPPYTAGALRGGSHVHMFRPAGDWLSFTYEDEVLARAGRGAEANLRTVAVGVPAGAIRVSGRHARNHDGTYFCAAVVAVTDSPRPGSDEIGRACEEAWVGTEGRSLAFQGEVALRNGKRVAEVFVVDLPRDIRDAGDRPLQGTPHGRPGVPRGCVQRRLTFTESRKYPGLSGPRHWLRSSPDGSRIGFLMRDDAGVSQFWTVSPRGEALACHTRFAADVGSAFTWLPSGTGATMANAGKVWVVTIPSGAVRCVSPAAGGTIRPEACVVSPDGRAVAYVRAAAGANQIAVARVA